MLIKFNLAALADVKAHEYLTRFLLGGATCIATGLIAHKFGPVIGGIFLAFPAIFPASATLVEHHEREKKARAGIPFTIRGRLSAALDARGALMGALALGLFAIIVWKLLPSDNAAVVLAGALLAWALLAGTLWRLRRWHTRWWIGRH
jgi:Protein of unknown function (DUF3147)